MGNRRQKTYLVREALRLSLSIILVCVVLFPELQPSAGVVMAASDDWPMFQHDPAHSGRTSATAYSSGPLYLQWAYSFGERVDVGVQPVIANGIVYVGVMNGDVHAIRANDGSSVWTARPGGPIAQTAAVDGNSVTVGSLDGNIYALSTLDGHKMWSYSTSGPILSAPAIVGGLILIGSNDGNLYALNKATGYEVWHFETGGPVVSSPSVVEGKVYFASQDLHARCVDAVTGNLLWDVPLQGAGMRNIHPVVSDDGSVVIFQTEKAGISSYLPDENYPAVSLSANPVDTWNGYYQAYPERRTLYYLSTQDGHDLWDPVNRRFVPLPIPYWGLLPPVLGSDGSAYFPIPAGTVGNDHSLDHDNRLIRVDLQTGLASQIAGGPGQPEFQLRTDEVGRAVFAGNDYFYTISEDLGVYHLQSGTAVALFSNGNPSGYNFGSHMDPLSPLPSLHLWRYGGAIAMGGVPGASVPIVSNGMIYYLSYGWLYAVGQQNRNLNPATSFPARDTRLHELTYPRKTVLSTQEIQNEIARRVEAYLALGPDNLPLAVRWSQPGNTTMHDNEFSLEVYGFEADLVRTLAKAYSYLSPEQQVRLGSYLHTVVGNTLVNPAHYAYEINCLIFGTPGIQVGNQACASDRDIMATWLVNNPNLVGLRLHALWLYALATNDWGSIQTNWNFIKSQFQDVFLDQGSCRPDPSLGFCVFEDWRVGRLNLSAQIAASEAMQAMAAHLGDNTLHTQAGAFLNTLLNARIALADYVPRLYDAGQRQPATIHLNPDGTIVNQDIMGSNSPYNADLIPYAPNVRNRDTDPTQVNWLDHSNSRLDACMGFMDYQALSGYFPLSDALIARLRTDLIDKTRYYVNSFEVNNPWWWMSDLTYNTTCGGEHLYHSPTLAWTMFQVKAYVLQEDWHFLASELPEPVSFNSKYDLFRLDNLLSLWERAEPDLSASRISISSLVPQMDSVVQVKITIQNAGRPFSDTISMNTRVPDGMEYIPGSLQASSGMVDDQQKPALTWSGELDNVNNAVVTFSALVNTQSVQPVNISAMIQMNSTGMVVKKLGVILNGKVGFMPLLMGENNWSMYEKSINGIEGIRNGKSSLEN